MSEQRTEAGTIEMDAADVLMRSARRKYLNDPERHAVVEVAINCLIATGCGDHRHALDPALVASMALEVAGHNGSSGDPS